MRIDPSLSSSTWSLNKTTQTRAETPLEALAKRDPEKAQMYQDTLDQLRQAVTSLKTSKVDVNAQRKAAAQDKIRRIKEQIKTLHMMAGSDPKMIAQQTARLAKELAAATKEYASAGGTDPVSAPASSNTVPVDQSANTPTTENSDTAIEGEQVSADSTNVTADDTAQNQTQDDAAVVADPATSFRDKMEAQAREVLQQSAAKKADLDFANEVKKLADELKIILRQQKAKLQHASDPQAEKSVKESEDALREVEKSLRTITQNTNIPTLNISA